MGQVRGRRPQPCGSFKPSFPYRMLQNNELAGVPAEALGELRSLQSL